MHILDEIEAKVRRDGSSADAAAVHGWIEKLKNQTLNIMFVGATGSGKSSTINAIFNTEIAKVGYSVDPQTFAVQKYEMDNLTLWDTPGLGDSPEKDRRYADQIVSTLKARDQDGNLLIDAVVMLIDGSNRDMGTTYEALEQIVIPYIGETSRLVIAINKCDEAMYGRHWNQEANQPDAQLISFLEEKADSVKKRLLSSTGISTDPLYYSALSHYNVNKLLLAMLNSIPDTKRFLVAASLNRDPDVWKRDDGLQNYSASIQSEVKNSLLGAVEGAASGAIAGATVGSFIPVIGTAVGAAIGAALGFLGGLFS